MTSVVGRIADGAVRARPAAAEKSRRDAGDRANEVVVREQGAVRRFLGARPPHEGTRGAAAAEVRARSIVVCSMSFRGG
jgi:hypothetical protein